MQFQKLCSDNRICVDLTKAPDADMAFQSGAVFTNFGTDITAADFPSCYGAAVENVQALADQLDEVTLLPGRYSLLRSAKAISDFLEKVDRDNVLVLLAPGELLANSSEDEMFYALDGKIAGLYVSDIDLTTLQDAILGDGDVAWTTVLSLWHDHCEDRPIYLPDNDRYDADAKFLEKLDEVARRMLG